MQTTTVYLVCGDNGLGNSGAGVFGMYPSYKLASARIEKLEAEGEGAEYMYIHEVEVGTKGADFHLFIGD